VGKTALRGWQNVAGEVPVERACFRVNFTFYVHGIQEYEVN
jgi:hypothetical protein